MESVADPKNIEARVNRSREAVASAIEVIANTRPSVRPKSSPIMALLEPHADVIRKALSDGWTAGAIARALHAKGVVFSEDAIRLRISAAFRSASETKPETRNGARTSVLPKDSAKRRASMTSVTATTKPLPERSGELTPAEQIARLDDAL